MKLVSLNTWGGKVFDPLISFIKQQSTDTDIFCFQEIYKTTSDIRQYKDIRANLLDELIKILPDFRFFYSIEISGFDTTPDPVNFDLTVGKAIFTKNNIKINSEEDLPIYGDRSKRFLRKDFSNLPVIVQSIDITSDSKRFVICNVHGTPFPSSKLDTALRLRHSQKIKDFLKTKQGAKIVTGDFNLLPETQSIKIYEKEMKNLIKEFNIQITRSRLSPFSNQPDFQKFADYTFVSSDVNVTNFKVPYVEISDHLPMILEFS